MWTQPFLRSLALANSSPTVIWNPAHPHPRRTRIPPCLTCLFDDYGSILLPARFWTGGAALHPLIRSEIKAFWGLHFPLPRVLGDEILCTNTLGVINQALRGRRRSSHDRNRCREETVCPPLGGGRSPRSKSILLLLKCGRDNRQTNVLCEFTSAEIEDLQFHWKPWGAALRTAAKEGKQLDFGVANVFTVNNQTAGGIIQRRCCIKGSV